MRRSRLSVLILTGVTMGVLAAESGAAAIDQRGGAPTSAPSKGALLGAYVQPDHWSKRAQKRSVNLLEAHTGQTLAIDHIFHPWNGNPFPTWRQKWDLRKGRVPMISWGPVRLSQVLEGSFDAEIRERADGLRRLGGPVLVRWFAEMDASSFQGNEVETPSQFVDAWRYVQRIFEDRGADNVEWVWCPDASAFTSGRAQDFYPGRAYVDWICADGYNWYPVRENSAWRSFKVIFADFYEWAAPTGKPLMIGDTGVLENQPGDKARWLRRMGRVLKKVYPRIKALVYFDAYASARVGGMYDWRLDTSSSSYAAFKALAGRLYFARGA